MDHPEPVLGREWLAAFQQPLKPRDLIAEVLLAVEPKRQRPRISEMRWAAPLDKTVQ